MLPSRWSPLRDLSTLHREFDELFNRFFGRAERPVPAIFEGWGTSYPPMDFARKADSLIVRLEMPGIDPKDVDISVLGNRLTIRGERKTDTETREEDYYVHEIGYGSFERTVTLPEGVETEKITAGYKDGILEITMPAKMIAGARKIEVATESGEKKILKAA